MAGAEEEKKMPLLEHLVELRKRLLFSVIGFAVAFVGCFFVAQHMFNFLAAPMPSISRRVGRRSIYTDLIEPFFTQLKLAAFGALCISFPIVASQIWAFVAPGLYKNERKAFLPFLVATPFMFLIGAAFFYYCAAALRDPVLRQLPVAGGAGRSADRRWRTRSANTSASS